MRARVLRGDHRAPSLSPVRLAVWLATVGGLLQLLILPGAGTDHAAQQARASFARVAPFSPVDFSWYAGVHPFGYSLLAPWVMALLGVGLSGLLAAALTAGLFARLTQGLLRPHLVAALGAVFAVADVTSGRTTFALGLSAGLACLVVLDRRGPAVVLAVLTAVLSPVAAALLGLAAGTLVLHRRGVGWWVGVATALPVVVLAVAFPGGGTQPYTYGDAWPLALVCLAVAWLSTTPVLRTGAVVYGVVAVLLPAIGNPLGANILRLALLFAVPLILASARRPWWLLALVCLPILRWQADPLLLDLSAPAAPPYAAVGRELVALDSRRVEVVAARDHGESASVASVVPLARGWSRQIDEKDNPLFYRDSLLATDYVSWLQLRGVDHVALPRGVAYDYGSKNEARLLQAGPVPGLVVVWRDADWTVFGVRPATPLAPPPATVVASGRTSLTLSSPRAGDVPVLLRWSRWLSVSGPACLTASGGQAVVRFRAPGTVVVGSSLLPHGHCG